MSNSSVLHVIARVRARREHADAVRQILVGFVAPTRRENGCITYDLFQSRSDPTDFTFVEAWDDQPALEAHSRSTHITEGRAKLQGLTEGPTQVLHYDQLA